MARNNECIDLRGDSYRLRIGYYDQLGVRKFYTKSFSVKKYGSKQKALEMARKHRDEIKVKLSNNMIIKNRKTSLQDAYDQAMSLYQVTKETKRKLDLIFNKYVLSEIDPETDLSDIKYNDIQNTLNKMISVARNDTIQRVFSIWKRIYKTAIASDMILKDETYAVIVPESEVIEKKRKMETDISQLYDVCDRIEEKIENGRDRILLQGALWIMYFTGMRPAEVFALHTDNIDLEKGKIYVCQALGSTSSEFNTIRKTKNSNSVRYVPIVQQLIPIMKELCNLAIDGYLFMRDNKKFLNSTMLSDTTRRLFGGTFRPYMLRHQFSTDLLINGTDIRTIQEMMGHASSTMTISYARSNDELKIKALEERNKDIKMIENIA